MFMMALGGYSGSDGSHPGSGGSGGSGFAGVNSSASSAKGFGKRVRDLLTLGALVAFVSCSSGNSSANIVPAKAGERIPTPAASYVPPPKYAIPAGNSEVVLTDGPTYLPAPTTSVGGRPAELPVQTPVQTSVPTPTVAAAAPTQPLETIVKSTPTATPKPTLAPAGVPTAVPEPVVYTLWDYRAGVESFKDGLEGRLRVEGIIDVNYVNYDSGVYETRFSGLPYFEIRVTGPGSVVKPISLSLEEFKALSSGGVLVDAVSGSLTDTAKNDFGNLDEGVYAVELVAKSGGEASEYNVMSLGFTVLPRPTPTPPPQPTLPATPVTPLPTPPDTPVPTPAPTEMPPVTPVPRPDVFIDGIVYEQIWDRGTYESEIKVTVGARHAGVDQFQLNFFGLVGLDEMISHKGSHPSDSILIYESIGAGSKKTITLSGDFEPGNYNLTAAVYSDDEPESYRDSNDKTLEFRVDAPIQTTQEAWEDCQKICFKPEFGPGNGISRFAGKVFITGEPTQLDMDYILAQIAFLQEKGYSVEITDDEGEARAIGYWAVDHRRFKEIFPDISEERLNTAAGYTSAVVSRGGEIQRVTFAVAKNRPNGGTPLTPLQIRVVGAQELYQALTGILADYGRRGMFSSDTNDAPESPTMGDERLLELHSQLKPGMSPEEVEERLQFSRN